MTIVSALIPEDLYKSLRSTSKLLNRSSSFLIREALTNHLEEIKEDIEDYNDAMEILARNEPTIPLEEVMKNLGFEDWDKKND
jgi:predicted DNA-binding protein